MLISRKAFQKQHQMFFHLDSFISLNMVSCKIILDRNDLFAYVVGEVVKGSENYVIDFELIDNRFAFSGRIELTLDSMKKINGKKMTV